MSGACTAQETAAGCGKSGGDVYILAVESSCDETAAAVVKNGREALSDVIASQIDIHTLYGGVVPEIASRRHIENINPVIRKALSEAGVTLKDISAVAVTCGPGLVGALLVGVAAAKAVAFAADKPLIGVHHIEGHISANYIANTELTPPFLCLVVSGGHTNLALVNDYTELEIIGQTRDDAAGEAFDKVARALGLGYPGGPAIDRAAAMGDPHSIELPHIKIDDAPYDFSFSGLKSAVLNQIYRISDQNAMHGDGTDGMPVGLDQRAVADIAASFQAEVVDILSSHAIEAARELGIRKLALAGGVAANRALRARLSDECRTKNMEFYCPPPVLCTDNAAMIGSAGYYMYVKGMFSDMSLNAMPNLPLGGRQRRYHNYAGQ